MDAMRTQSSEHGLTTGAEKIKMRKAVREPFAWIRCNLQ